MCGRMSCAISKLPFKDRLMKLGFNDPVEATYRNSGRIFFRMPEEKDENKVFAANWVGHARKERIAWWLKNLSANGKAREVIIPGFDHIEHYDPGSGKTVVLRLEEPGNFNAIAYIPAGKKQVFIKVVTEEKIIAGKAGRWPSGLWDKRPFSVSFENRRTY